MVPLRLEPAESVFVVFRERSQKSEVRSQKNFSELKPVMELTGPWEVQFDPKWGGPAESVTFTTLTDWSKHAEPGIKYYSGTATYRKTFAWSGTSIVPVSASAKRSTAKMAVPLFLDLGEVAVMAEVKLNGQCAGIAWKAPYRLDVTGLLKPGNNTVEIRVVNLWPNRLIGDEQRPEDAEWRAPHGLDPAGNYRILKNWPQWLLDGKPSPAGRLTFATVRKYTKDDPLLPSGLLGPVRVLAAE
jgi:hypothetical protein